MTAWGVRYTFHLLSTTVPKARWQHGLATGQTRRCAVCNLDALAGYNTDSDTLGERDSYHDIGLLGPVQLLGRWRGTSFLPVRVGCGALGDQRFL